MAGERPIAGTGTRFSVAGVPGFAGIRSPKWLGRITVQENPSDGHVQARDDELSAPDVAVWDQAGSTDEMPLTSAVCTPTANETRLAGPVTVRGYAPSRPQAVWNFKVYLSAARHRVGLTTV